MRLIFTYHEVKDFAKGSEPGFYAISPERLGRELEILSARGLKPARLEDLVGGLGEDRYVLTFDDGTVDHYEVVLPFLEKLGCKASFFVPTEKLGKPGFLTREQVKRIAAEGHEIGSHSHEHERMDTLTAEEIKRRIGVSQRIIQEITGVRPVSFVPPGGFTNEQVREGAAEMGVRVMRTMRGGYNLKLDLMALETVPINRYTDERKFTRLLEPRSGSVLYAGKEALKRVLPMRAYEKLRRLAFRLRD